MKFSFALCLFFLISCGNQLEKGKFNTEKAVVREAKTLYLIHCESCHGLEGNKGISGAADLSKSVLSDKTIKNVILQGNDKGMMPYKDIITNTEEVNSLRDYVKSLRK